MTAHAVWDDGHGVGIPGKMLAELEVAWRQAERWDVAHFLPDRDAGSPRILDSVEQHLNETAALEASKLQRTILTHSGPQWSLQPARSGERPERDDRADYCPWTRGTPLLDGGAWWLVCRMSGLSIPLLSHEET